MNYKYRSLYNFIFAILALNVNITRSWSWIYSSNVLPIKQIDIKNNNKKNTWIWTKNNTPAYSQLLFSWNGIKPKQGYFTFWVCSLSKNIKGKRKWHKMTSWGNNIQESYYSKIRHAKCSKVPAKYTEYIHVRLELPESYNANGFAVKVTMHNGANISDLKSVSINLINMRKFRSELKPNIKFNNILKYSKYESIIIKGMPKLSQMEIDHERNDSLCSPTSLTMVINYISKQNLDPLNVAKNIYDKGLDAYGSWPFNTAYAYQACNKKALFQVVRLNSFDDVYKQLKRSIPVIVSVRGPLKGSATPYANGHLLVIIGYNAKKNNVICHDPAFNSKDEVYKEYNLKDFIAAWERSKRLSYKLIV